jgi:hypothetical protein
MQAKTNTAYNVAIETPVLGNRKPERIVSVDTNPRHARQPVTQQNFIDVLL